MITILIADDELTQRDSLAEYYAEKKYKALAASCGRDALKLVKENAVDLVLSDYRMHDMNGYELMLEIRKINPEIPVIIMTAFGSVETAVTAMKDGAFYYLQKPINLDELDILIDRALYQRQLTAEVKQLKDELSEKFRFESIIYSSSEMAESLNTAARVAKSQAPVVIRGESGTGKELFARAIHFASTRKNEPFVVVNCAALPETLLESEMFGYEKGAFTGAVNRRIGRFEEAGNGTIFIDEIGDMPASIQVKLLRVLQSGEFSRLGSNEIIRTNARLITATNINLEELMAEGRFREDFYYRINVVSISIPPLRERKADIPHLIDHFLSKICNSEKQFSKEAFDLLLKYSYPGNVRELENIVRRACVLARERLITTQDIPSSLRNLEAEYFAGSFRPHIGDFNRQVTAIEKEIISMAIKEADGNQSKAARMINLSERNLRYKIKKYFGRGKDSRADYE